MKYLLIYLLLLASSLSCTHSRLLPERHPLNGEVTETMPTSSQKVDSEKNSKKRDPSSTAHSGFVTLVYHRLDRNLSTSVQPELFRQQMRYLKENDFNVLQVEDALKRMQNATLPERAVVITFDDAYESTLIAHDIMVEFNFPYTIFVSTSFIGKKPYLTWEQLRELTNNSLVSIANHSHNHYNMVDPKISLEKSKTDLSEAKELLQTNLNLDPAILAWPYGETNNQLIDLAASLGFDYAFAQSSGAVSNEINYFRLPRFPISDAFGQLVGPQKTGFELKVNSLPLPLNLVSPSEPILRGEILDEVIFSLSTKYKNYAKALNCYFNGQAIRVLPLIDRRNHFSVNIARKLDRRRSKLTCTAYGSPGELGRANRFLWHTFIIVDTTYPEG